MPRNFVKDVKRMIAIMKRDRWFGPYEIHIPIGRAAHTTTIEDGLEFWDFGSDEFVLEAWDVMTFGGVRVDCQIHGFAIINLNGITVIPWSEHRV